MVIVNAFNVLATFAHKCNTFSLSYRYNNWYLLGAVGTSIAGDVWINDAVNGTDGSNPTTLFPPIWERKDVGEI